MTTSYKSGLLPIVGNEAIIKAQKERSELDGLLHVLEVTDRIVAGRELNIYLSGAPDTNTYFDSAGAWTDGKDIFINGEAVSQLRGRDDINFRQFIATVKGLNYHELAHVIFTPRLQGRLANKVRTIGESRGYLEAYWWSFNALEDQRAEMLFGGRHRLAFDYFKHVNLNLILRRPNQEFKNLLPLMHGRLFLPSDLRHSLRRLHTKEHGSTVTNEFISIIERYIVIDTQKSDINEAFNLIEAMAVLVIDSGKTPPEVGGGHSYTPDSMDRGTESETLDRGGSYGNKNVKAAANRQDEPESPDEKLKDKVKDLIDSDKDDNPFVEGPSVKADDGEEGEGSGSSDDLDDDSDDGPSFKNKSQVSGTVDEYDKTLDAMDVRDIADEEYDNSLSSSALSKDLNDTIKAARGATKDKTKVTDDRLGGYSQYPVTSDMKLSKNAIIPVLRDIKLDLEPRWEHGQSSGVLDPYKAMESELTGNLDVFDVWDEGSEEEGGIEMIMLIDLSTSMRSLRSGEWSRGSWNSSDQLVTQIKTGVMPSDESGAIVPASQAVWILSSALGEIDVPVTVIGYNENWRMLVFSEERESKVNYKLFDVSGGTDPASALNEAMAILVKSNKRNKVVAIFTDGAWIRTDKVRYTAYNGSESRGTSEHIIDAMNASGITTVLFGINNAVKQSGGHKCQIAIDIESPMEMVKAVADMVERVMKEAKLKM